MPTLSFEFFNDALDYVNNVSELDRNANNMNNSQYAKYETTMRPLIEQSSTGYFSDCFNYSPKDHGDYRDEALRYIMGETIQLSKRKKQ